MCAFVVLDLILSSNVLSEKLLWNNIVLLGLTRIMTIYYTTNTHSHTIFAEIFRWTKVIQFPPRFSLFTFLNLCTLLGRLKQLFRFFWHSILQCLTAPNSIWLCQFLPREAMLSAVYAVVVCLCVCLSVCLSHSGIVSKRLKVGSRKQRHTIAPWF